MLQSNSESAQDHILKGRGMCQEEGFLNVTGYVKILTDDDKPMRRPVSQPARSSFLGDSKHKSSGQTLENSTSSIRGP